MSERPEKWEVVCKICFAGFIMDDVEVGRRLDRRQFYEHCGEVMQLRHIMTEMPKPDCSHAGCWNAAKAVCGCSCRGRNHGVMNPNPEYSKVILAEPAWYKVPIKTLISAPN